jgi:hypothetical protein
MNPAPRSAGIAALFIALAVSLAAAQQSSAPGPNVSTLTTASLNVLPDQTTVTFVAGGPGLRGVVTMQLRPAAGGVYDGEWAFTVAHADPTDPATGEEPPLEQHEDGEAHSHKDFLTLVHRGSLQGTVLGARLTVGADGKLTALTAPLSISAGFGEFTGAAGWGSATLAELTLSF